MISFSVHFRSDYEIISKTVRYFKRGQFDQITHILSNIDWDHFMAGTAEECWVRFRDLLSKMVDKYVPLKRVSKRKTVGKPIWMTHKAKKLVSRKRKAYNKYKDSQHPAVKSACKAARVELRNSRRNFEKKLADNIKDDNKSFFLLTLVARLKVKSKLVHLLEVIWHSSRICGGYG